jgi:hypothetical protein
MKLIMYSENASNIGMLMTRKPGMQDFAFGIARSLQQKTLYLF